MMVQPVMCQKFLFGTEYLQKPAFKHTVENLANALWKSKNIKQWKHLNGILKLNC